MSLREAFKCEENFMTKVGLAYKRNGKKKHSKKQEDGEYINVFEEQEKGEEQI